eukprot:GHRQ01037487.1.p2 GENE.GHRQ01037487.1~~GHRQ01037487.1.p2  ORF type:complete len:105 (+),score=4.72 GHRQ01037487.1:110-424(+)
MKVLRRSISACSAPGPAPGPASAAALRLVSESARFCMVHSMRPARTSRSSWRKGSKNFTWKLGGCGDRRQADELERWCECWHGLATQTAVNTVVGWTPRNTTST